MFQMSGFPFMLNMNKLIFVTFNSCLIIIFKKINRLKKSDYVAFVYKGFVPKSF